MWRDVSNANSINDTNTALILCNLFVFVCLPSLYIYSHSWDHWQLLTYTETHQYSGCVLLSKYQDVSGKPCYLLSKTLRNAQKTLEIYKNWILISTKNVFWIFVLSGKYASVCLRKKTTKLFSTFVGYVRRMNMNDLNSKQTERNKLEFEFIKSATYRNCTVHTSWEIYGVGEIDGLELNRWLMGPTKELTQINCLLKKFYEIFHCSKF